MSTVLKVRHQEIIAFIEKATEVLNNEGHDEFNEFLNFHKFETLEKAPLDIESAEFYEYQVNLWRIVSGRNIYDPYKTELDPNLHHIKSICDTYPFSSKNPTVISNYFSALPNILAKLGCSPPSQILEWGIGWGHTTRFFANSGYRVTAVDIEPQFLDMLSKFSFPGTPFIETILASFEDAPLKNSGYDAIVFFECFHHCLQHRALLKRVVASLRPGGRIVFCGEPFYDDWFEFPWGLRLDGHAVWAIRNLGWMELGFRKNYIDALLHENHLTAVWSTIPNLGTFGEFLIAEKAAC